MYTKGLIELRRSRPAFRLRTGEEVRRFLQFLEVPRGGNWFCPGAPCGRGQL